MTSFSKRFKTYHDFIDWKLTNLCAYDRRGRDEALRRTKVFMKSLKVHSMISWYDIDENPDDEEGAYHVYYRMYKDKKDNIMRLVYMDSLENEE